MGSVLSALEPKDVFHYFEEICSIPHGSGNIRRISDYLVDFARERELLHYQDEAGNVIIIKEATEGYEQAEPVMLQGHMDMVAVKKPGSSIDMEKEGLRLAVSGDRIYAEDTSLGGDDGIAVACGLALLAGKEYRHPRIELVVTVDEETGMDGARAVDLSVCKAKRMINLDSEEEGIFLTGCAGGARVNYGFSYEEVKRQGFPCRILVEGLMGGHSGAEIHKERGNANNLLGRMLYELSEQFFFGIVSLEGGLADNAIPRQAEAQLLITAFKQNGEKQDSISKEHYKETLRRLKALEEKADKELKAELAEKDPEVRVRIELLSAGEGEEAFLQERGCMEEGSSFRTAAFLNTIPYGVQAMSGSLQGMVETSLNLGILSCREGGFHAGISVRSSLESAKEALIGRLKSLAALAGAETEVTGSYPGWAYRKDSPLRDKMTEVFRRMYGHEPEIQAIHAGLECGLLAEKIPGLDCVSIGPDMQNIHTTEEELSISSTERVWRFLLKVLEEMR